MCAFQNSIELHAKSSPVLLIQSESYFLEREWVMIEIKRQNVYKSWFQ